MPQANTINRQIEIIGILNSILSIEGNRESLQSESRLLGALPEFDSLAVVAVIEALEEHFGFTASDEDITESTFLTVGHLVKYVEGKLEQ
jgi:acyl carrier protein